MLQVEIWKGVGEGYTGNAEDQLQVEVLQPWLELAEPRSSAKQPKIAEGATPASHSKPHKHDDHHDHVHEERQEVEQRAVELEGGGDKSKLTAAVLKVLLLDLDRSVLMLMQIWRR